MKMPDVIGLEERVDDQLPIRRHAMRCAAKEAVLRKPDLRQIRSDRREECVEIESLVTRPYEPVALLCKRGHEIHAARVLAAKRLRVRRVNSAARKIVAPSMIGADDRFAGSR